MAVLVGLISRGDLLAELVTALRQEGLDARSTEGADRFVVGEVELRRGLEGRLRLHLTRLGSGAPFLPPGGPFGWSADR